MGWERARQPEQVEHRKGAIITAAAKLFASLGCEKTSLSAIARASGVSKAAIYRYFESREEIFLRLLLEDQTDWVQAVEAALAPLADSGDVDAVSDALAETIIARPRLAALMARTGSVLEHNVSADAVRAFKRELLPLSLRALNALHAALPALNMQDTQRFIMHFIMYANGLQPQADPPAAVTEVLAEPEFEPFRIDYASSLRDHARLLLRGLLAS